MTRRQLSEALRVLLGSVLVAGGFISLLWAVELAFIQ